MGATAIRSPNLLGTLVGESDELRYSDMLIQILHCNFIWPVNDDKEQIWLGTCWGDKQGCSLGIVLNSSWNLKLFTFLIPSGADTGISRADLVNTMAADALAICGARSSAAVSICIMNRPLSSRRKDFNYMHHNQC